ncbi:MAG: CbtA family protein [Verrucomicrobia bacterium]|nr:CbtA family protein [Verrucomicrobiota bacterium]
MVRSLLIWGMLVGIVAGLLAFGFAKAFGEAQVERAIAFEEKQDRAQGDPPEPALVSREVQSGVGLFTGTVVYGTALGGLFALGFAFAYGRVGPPSARVMAALLAGAGFLALVLVPQLKYPANPPAVGQPGTIGYRSEWFFFMLLISLAALVTALMIGRSLAGRCGGWNAGLLAAAAFVGLIVVAQFLLPDINEVPDQFPAVVLWRFRIASLGMQLILWSTLGLLFGAAAERVLSKQGQA